MCDTVYYHKYYPTKFNDINVPWYPNNQCPFARTEPITWPHVIGTFMQSIPTNPNVGTYGSCKMNENGKVTQDDCQVGMHPVEYNKKGCQCADIYGNVSNSSL